MSGLNLLGFSVTMFEMIKSPFTWLRVRCLLNTSVGSSTVYTNGSGSGVDVGVIREGTTALGVQI